MGTAFKTVVESVVNLVDHLIDLFPESARIVRQAIFRSRLANGEMSFSKSGPRRCQWHILHETFAQQCPGVILHDEKIVMREGYEINMKNRFYCDKHRHMAQDEYNKYKE